MNMFVTVLSAWGYVQYICTFDVHWWIDTWQK